MLYVLAFSLGTWTNMKVLQTANVETVIVFRSCCPIVVAGFDYIFYGRACPSLRSVASLLLITGGAVGYILNDKEFQNSGWVAYYWVMIWWTVLIFQLTYGKFLVSGLALKSLWTPVLYTNTLSVLPAMLVGMMAGELSQVSLAWLPIDPPLSPLLAPETATHYFVARGRAAIVLAQLQDHEAGDPSEMLRWASAAQTATESARGSGFLEAPQELSQGLSLLQSQAVLYYALGQHRVGSEDRALRELKAAFDGLPKHEDWAKAMRKTIRKVYDAAKALKKARRDAENVAYRRMFS